MLKSTVCFACSARLDGCVYVCACCLCRRCRNDSQQRPNKSGQVDEVGVVQGVLSDVERRYEDLCRTAFKCMACCTCAFNVFGGDIDGLSSTPTVALMLE